jgi:aspartate-semialdehyde dehydrogenase
LVSVSLELRAKPSEAELRHAIEQFEGEPQRLKLPSAPAKPLLYLPEADRPQPRRDAGRDRGMTATMGRLRACPVLDWKFLVMAHNTIRGAAGAAVLNAELLVETGHLPA